MFIIIGEDSAIYDIVEYKEQVPKSAHLISEDEASFLIEEWKLTAGGWQHVDDFEGYVHDGVFGWCY